jgi:hypothetical protein
MLRAITRDVAAKHGLQRALSRSGVPDIAVHYEIGGQQSE